MSIVKQIGGDHYGGVAFQHWDFVLQCGQPYLTAVATKYLARWRQKDGIGDVLKSLSYVDKTLDALANGELSWPLPTDHAKARALWPTYCEVYNMPELDHDASELLIFALNVHDLLTARALIQRIIATEVFSWEALKPIAERMKPDGWQGYTFEGVKENRCWHRCGKCKTQFVAPVNEPPMLYHDCG